MRGGSGGACSAPKGPGRSSGPSGPSTGGPSTAGPSAGPTTKGGTPYVATPRGPSSRTTLTIVWEHPTPRARAAGSTGPTAAPERRHALPAAEALAEIAGADQRPLLVLRECELCSGTEDALLSSTESNERTYLLARWFHCVKLAPDVLADDHPFRNLFPGDAPAHLFIANRDGSARHDLSGEQSRRELWGAMETAIGANYIGSAETVLTRLERLLDSMDEVDRSLADMQTRYELAVAADGADASKVKKLQADLTERRTQRDELLAAAARVATLQPKPLAPAAGK